MLRTPWRLVFIGGTLAALTAAPFGSLAQSAIALFGFLMVFTGVLVGVARWRPASKTPWFMMGGGALLFFLQFITQAIDPSLRFTATSGMTAANYIGIAAYLSTAMGMHLLGRLRTNDKDPTNLIDALVFACGVGIVMGGVSVVPMLANPELTSATKTANVVFDLLDLLLFFTFARLVIGPGMKNASYRLLSLVPISMLLSDQLIAIGEAQMHFFGEFTLTLLIPSIGCAGGAAAAIHPSMVDITLPADVGIATMTRKRFVLMTFAVLAPPATLLIVPTSSWAWMVVAWLFVVALVMIRFSGLVRARERVAVIDSVLTKASAALVSATTRQEMYDAALSATMEITETYCNHIRSSLAIVEGGVWEIRASRGWHHDLAITTQVNSDVIEAALSRNSSVPVHLCDIPSFDTDDYEIRTTLLITLVSQNKVRGALVISGEDPFPSFVVDAMGTLGTHLALALEAAGLSEDLHRRRSDRRFRALVENSNDVVLVIAQDGKPTFMSPAAERLLEWSGGTPDAFDAIHESDRAAFIALVEDTRASGGQFDRRRTLECRIVGLGGHIRWIEATATNMTSESEVAGIVVNAHDITDRKALEEDLRHQVLHDSLTGIPNRVLLRERVDHALSMRRHNRGIVAMLFIDLDDFKTVNDGLGHAAGDELLKIIAFRIYNFVRDHDTTARLGGDEFAVLLQGVDSVADVEVVAARLLKVIQEPVEFKERQIQIGASIGIATAESGYDSGVLLRNADVAMYDAKRNGKGRVVVFDESMYVSAVERLDLKADLGRAVERDELVVYYQPLVDLQNGGLSGFEALVRWVHPQRGFVSPASFIPLAEETGLIVDIGAWVLRKALQQLAIWHKEHPDFPLKMSVNVSPRQLEEGNIVSDVATALKEAGVDPSWVTLELTESAGLDNTVTRDRLIQLGHLGVGIAADDFGSGFASYAALQQLPFTAVKIDRSLILGLESNFQKANAQLRSIIDMAHSTGLRVVAEGIEDSHQRDLITSMGCDCGQGFLFGRPMPADAAGNFLCDATTASGEFVQPSTSLHAGGR